MISRESLRPWLGRPVALAVFAVVALAALLSGSLVVARAVDGAPAASTASPTPSAGTGGAGDNAVAGVVNTTDGRTAYAITLKIVQTTADTVDASNVAAAVASCTDCTTVAISFEGILLAGSPTDFEPTNLALAYNVECSGCTTFADAYQQVVQRSTRVRITGAGRQKVAEIRLDLESLRHENLSLEEIYARVKADEAAFADVLLNDCVPIGHYTDVQSAPSATATTSPTADSSGQPGASTAAAPTTSASDSPTASPDPSPSESASPTPTDSPSP